jgi:hypothetical protein
MQGKYRASKIREMVYEHEKASSVTSSGRDLNVRKQCQVHPDAGM